MIVENKPGAGGMIGNDLVAKSPPDGYTVLLGITAIIQGPHLFTKIPYDVMKDLIPLRRSVFRRIFFVVPARFPANTFEEFIAEVKATRKRAMGPTAPRHRPTSMAKCSRKTSRAGSDPHSLYKGGAPQLTDHSRGQLDAAFIDVGNLRAQAKSDKIKILASTGEKRSDPAKRALAD